MHIAQTEPKEQKELTIEEAVNHEYELQKLNPYFVKFEDFPYDEWKPVRQRYDFVNAHAEGERILDIGCGYYPITSEVNASYKVGIDVSKKAAQKAWKDFDDFYFMDITNAPVFHLKEKLGRFDTIVASEVIEHIKQPRDLLERMKALLLPGGKILLTIPSGESLAGKIDKMRHHGQYERYKMFHRTHVSCLPLPEWYQTFSDAGLQVTYFDYRPTDIVEGFPKETTPGWKTFTKISPRYMAHQYFFVLEAKSAS